ncbi:zinc ribbon domain-containing protein [Haloarcula litorea]|uniref:zinc ribbon domain-containing protein n=1 Tax=Haloarcula litorea TaxID=3032579 RepID=UPI0023E855A4|nr:zinc ribbon domain-containing protein [Halomicroarcula sp. GDY20]
MGVLDSITELFGSAGADKYECADCGAVFQVETGTDDPRCETCGSTAVTFINHV